jgi:hypothetical protein
MIGFALVDQKAKIIAIKLLSFIFNCQGSILPKFKPNLIPDKADNFPFLYRGSEKVIIIKTFKENSTNLIGCRNELITEFFNLSSCIL